LNIRQLSEMSVDHYNAHAKSYYEQTLSVDLSNLYQPILALIPACGHILDAGSGSGRDTKEFLRRGYTVTAIDASWEMTRLSSQLTGQQTLHMRFQEMNFQECFDGIWACASLLHVPRDEIALVFQRLTVALKPRGVWYMSFKLGSEERITGDRLFNDYNEPLIKQLLSKHSSLELLEVWQTLDKMPNSRNLRWINVLARKLYS
jgi:SAM-dependent methyltransferase